MTIYPLLFTLTNTLQINIYRCNVMFLFSQMFQPCIGSGVPFISVTFKFWNFTCHEVHKRSVIYEQFKTTDAIYNTTPRRSQTKAIQNKGNKYNPYSNKNESIPTRKSCANARYRATSGAMFQKLQDIQEYQIRKTKHNKNIACTFIGDIHCLMHTKFYLTFSIWNKMSMFLNYLLL